jgi:ATP-dependent helicase/nuclease subunit B
LVERLAEWGAPFATVIAQPDVKLLDAIGAHIGFAESLAASGDEAGANRLWADEAGVAAANFIAELTQAAGNFKPFPGGHYAPLLEALMSAQTVRPRYGRHPRLAIWGPLEARLQSVDLLVLGGLNEGTWPAETPADPWLSRPMRRVLGMAAPERRIGLSAHDFAQALGAREVMLTRSLRVEGTPTVPSRWLLRLDGLLRTLGLDPERLHDDRWLDWQMKLDQPARVAPIEPPEPRPPVAKRPRRLSVTEIENWRRDPYAIYAKFILRLRALDPIDAEPGAADRGIQIHRALERFVTEFPGQLPADAHVRLLDMGRQAFGELLDHPAVRTFWWPRFERIAAWYLEQESERRATIAALHGEVKGSLSVAGVAKPFQLTAKADRIERGADGSLDIIDYKTGALPKAGDINLGMSPQLPLEAAIAAFGGFDGVPKGPVGGLAFWKLGGGDPPGLIVPIKGDPMELARQALEGLQRLVHEFDRQETPYRAMPDPAFAPRYSDYGHLARIKEWSAGAGGEGE